MNIRHLLKRTTLLVVPFTLAALFLGMPAAAPTDLQDVTLTCSDGTYLELALDVESVTQLADAVTAMALNPAGDPPLTCSLAQAGPLLQSSTSLGRALASVSPRPKAHHVRKSARQQSRTLSAGNPRYDYVVGGGQAPALGCPVLTTSFGLSAHVAQGALPTTASGTFNVGSPAPNGFCKGSFTSKVDCLQVTGPSAHLTAKVTQATGVFEGLLGTEIDVALLDNGTPTAIVPDMMDDGNTSGPCAQGTEFGGGPTAADQPVLNGNVAVNDAP
jgi:hypothetical protein